MKYIKGKTALFMGDIIGLMLLSMQVLPVSSFSEPLGSPPDCSQWNLVSSEPLKINFFVGVLQTIDLWDGTYKNPKDHSTCTRYFFKSTGETVAQMWKEADGHSSAYLLLRGHDPYVVEHAEIRWRPADPYAEIPRKDNTLFYAIEIGILKEDADQLAEPILSTVLTVQVTAAPLKQV